MKNLNNKISRIAFIAFAFIAFISMSSCEDLFEFELAEANSKPDLTPPSASFKATATNDYLTYKFANNSISATDYVWNFGLDGDGDGAIDTSTTLDSEYTFPGEGTFTITLTATDKLGVSNTASLDIEVVEPPIPLAIVPEILNGDFSEGQDNWRIRRSSGSNRNPYNASSDGSNNNYDGSDNGSKTPGAKWTGSTSFENPLTNSVRFAYQTITVSPNTIYLLDYEYAIKADKDDIDGGDRIIVEILDGWHDLDEDAVASSVAGPLTQSIGTIANGRGNFERVRQTFTSNATGEISIMIYAITNDELYIDNIKVYPN